MRLPLCACILFAAAVALPAAITVGDTYRKVLKEKGRPSGKIEAGSTLSLHYPEQIIKLDRGRVVAIETPPAREAPAGEAAAAAVPATAATTGSERRGAPRATVQAGRWTTDYSAALQAAKQRKQRVFLLFTGHDWSGSCMRLQHEILSTPKFRSYASQNLMLVELEFPKNRKLSPALKAQNDKLKRHYGIQTFPVVVVLDNSGRQLGMLGYMEGGPEAFIAALKEL